MGRAKFEVTSKLGNKPSTPNRLGGRATAVRITAAHCARLPFAAARHISSESAAGPAGMITDLPSWHWHGEPGCTVRYGTPVRSARRGRAS
eukprot:704836-Hanusia_phi.AAC.4